MRQFPKEMGKYGHVFNFITYGGHQVDGVRGEGPPPPCSRTAIRPRPVCNASRGLSQSPHKDPQLLAGGPVCMVRLL